MHILTQPSMQFAKRHVKKSAQSSKLTKARFQFQSPRREDGGAETAQEEAGCPRGLNPTCPFAMTCQSEGPVCANRTNRTLVI